MAGQEMEIQLERPTTYVIAFSSWDNPIEMKVVKSNSEPLAVLKEFLLGKSTDWSDLTECQTVEALQQFVFDCDCEISIIEVK